MVKFCLLKFIVPAVCFFSFVHGVSNADLPEMGHREDSPLRNDMKILSPRTYKGVALINDCGWGVTLHSSLKQIELDSKLYDVKHFPNEKFGFSLIKIDLGNDHQRAVLPKFLYLATPEDLEYYSHWVTSCALVPSLDLNNGKISDDKEFIKSYKRPLSCYSKVEKQENGLLYLDLGESMNKCYEELRPQVKKTLIDCRLKNYSHIVELEESLDYQRKYLQNKKQAVTQKRDFLMKELNTLQSQIQLLIDQKKGIKDTFLIKTTELQIDYLQKEMFSKQKEIADLLLLDEKKLWGAHLKELEAKKDNFINQAHVIHNNKNISDNIKLALNKFYYSSYYGVPDREDQGGFIYTPSKGNILKNNRYDYDLKFVGITINGHGNDFIEGRKSVAIDLTTKEVRDWISKTMDDYYADQENNNVNVNNKRPGDESGPSDPNKKPRIKEEIEGNDAAISNMNPIKEESEETNIDFTSL